MKCFLIILLTLLCLFANPVFGQNDPAESGYSFADTLSESTSLFDSDELLEITLRFDLRYYQKKKPDEEYLNAILSYINSNDDSEIRNIRVRSRGNFRRNFCDFPPLLLNFKMSDSVKGEFYGINKLKVVPHCKAGYETYVLKEYLIYKLFNVLTDSSYKVRLLRVNYVDSGDKIKPMQKYGFVIEPTDLLARRLNSTEVKSLNLTQKNIDPEMMDRMAIFNYMIGNTDWSVPNKHNVTILSQLQSSRPDLGMIVPYDFDYTGLVNADYAIPIEELGISSIRERLYVGICRSEEVFTKALREFSANREEFIKVITDFPYLNERTKKEMVTYLNGFFSQFDKRNTIVTRLLGDCKDF